MPVTALQPWSNTSAAALSNSLSMCSWSADGSVVPSTLSSSSSDMK